MHIGISFNLKNDEPLPPGAPADLFEEFDSPKTIHALADVLKGMGHRVSLLGDGRPFLEAILKDAPDLVFNFAEGTGISRNREARVPAVCEMLGIPYTGSDPLALAVALDKDMTRRIAEHAGVTLPKGFIMNPQLPYEGDFAEFREVLAEAGLTLPVIAKPTFEGSSKGMWERCLITQLEEFGPTIIRLATAYKQPILVEEFIDGDEVTVGLIGNDPPQIVAVMKIFPQVPEEKFVYTVEKKRESDKWVDYECPAKYPPKLLRDLERASLTMFDALGCRDVARVDFRIRDGVPYFLEINTLPGLNAVSSDLCIMAKYIGIPHEKVIGMIVDAACRRVGLS